MNETTSILLTRPMDDLAAAREEYLRGEPAPAGVRPVVLESWERSRRHGIDPEHLRQQSLDPARLLARRERSRRLLEIAQPFLDLVNEALSDQPHLIVLADPQGVILYARTGPGLPDDLERSNLFEGASWHERDIGCNGVGTCLVTGEPVILMGPEHFQASYVGWTCIGVPIHGPGGEVLGALDLSVPNEFVHVHSWGWILSIAKGIEASLGRGATPRREAPVPALDGIEEPLRSVHGVFELLATQLDLPATHAGIMEKARAKVAEAQTRLTEMVGRLAEAYEQARRALEERDNLLAVVSHDLRNPLNAIALAGFALREEPDGDEARRQAAVIQRSVDQMLRLVEDLLEASRIEAGGLVLTPEICPSSDLVSAALESMAPLAAPAAHDLRTELRTTLEVEADRARILRVFSNLIGNAIQHTPRGGTITIRAEADSERGDRVRFSVHDNGAGISTEHLPLVFDRYWQAGSSRRDGAGLGLTIARGIVEAHGGRIWVESEFGVGTSFYFTLATAQG